MTTESSLSDSSHLGSRVTGLVGSIILCTTLLAPAAEGQGMCPFDINFDASPGYTALRAFIGYGGYGSTYDRSGLLAPEPIPLGVDLVDSDKIYIWCGQVCTQQTVPGKWQCDWSVSTSGGAEAGKFVNPMVTLLDDATDATHVMFLPPGDLAPGAPPRDVEVKATIRDVCASGATDPVFEVNFPIKITRDPAGTYQIVVNYMQTNPAAISPAGCDQPPNPPPCAAGCVLEQQGAPIDIAGGIAEYPAQGMVLGETRPIMSNVEDLDILQWECSNEIDNCHAAGMLTICDRISYNWAVTGGTGSGEFLNHDRTTLFRATAPGTVTISLAATAPDLEFLFDSVSFEIYAPRVRVLSFDDTLKMYRDGLASEYPEIQWKDFDGDGSAADEREHRIPVAYLKGSTVKASKVIITCDTKAPPAAVILGSDPENRIFADSIHGDVEGVSAIEIGTKDLLSSTPLPAAVRRYHPYAVDWEVSFGNENYVPAGTTDNLLYTTLNMPELSAGQKEWESLYDLTCMAADGKSNSLEVFEAIWAKFASLEVDRKEWTGFNFKDQKRLSYWLTADPDCTTLALLLSSSSGDAACEIWATFLRECLRLHGLRADDPGLTSAQIPAATDAPPRLWEVWAPPYPHNNPSSQPIFLVNTWSYKREYACPDGAVMDTVNPDTVNDFVATYQSQYTGHSASRHFQVIAPGQNLVFDTSIHPDDHIVMAPDNQLLNIDAYHKNQLGISAQNNNDPNAIFPNHALIRFAGKFYDPSYGSGPFMNFVEYEDSYLFGSGFAQAGVALRVLGFPNMTYVLGD